MMIDFARVVLVLITLTSCTKNTPSEQNTPDLVRAREEVRQSEIAFASAFKDRDMKKFLSFIDRDARFLSEKKTASGILEIETHWKKLLEPASPPFAWQPKIVEVNGDGTIGFSSGPVTDPSGQHVADFSSVWQRKGDGTWKVIFDGPGCAVCELK